MDLADVGLSAGDLDAHGDRVAVCVPDHAAGGLSRHHRHGVGVDQAGLAQMT
jgi:hypothetical protein